MATQPGYTGTASVAPNLEPMRSVNVDAPVEAFGGAVGKAEQRSGGAMESVGTELFSRAMAMQQVSQDMEALNAVAKTSRLMGDRSEQFHQLSGLAAHNDLPSFQSDIDKAREEGGQGLSPYARLRYEQETRSLQQRLNLMAGAHAGEQFKHYVTGSNEAAADSAIRTVGLIPESDETFAKSIDTIKSRANDMAVPMGWNEDQKNHWIFDKTSAAVKERIEAMARTDVGGAYKALDKATQDGLVDKATAGSLKDKIDGHFTNVATRVFVPKIFSGEDGRLGDQKVPVENLLYAIRGNEGAGSYNPPHPTIAKGPYAGQHALGAYGIMQGNLQPWLKEAGMPAMSEAEFLKDRDAQDKLAAFKLGQLQDKYGSANKAALAWFTGDPNPDPGRSDGYHTAAWYKQNLNANLAKSVSVAKIAEVAKAHAEEIAPGNALVSQHISDAAETEAIRQRREAKEEQKGYADTIGRALAPGPDGKVPTKIEDIADPAVHEAYLSIKDPKTKAAIDKQFRQNAESGGYAKTAETVDTYYEWLGKYRNPETLPKDQREELLTQSVWTLPIPYQYQQKLYAAQEDLRKNLEKNPRIQDVMAENKPTLDAFGIGTHQDKDHKRLHAFQGAFHEAAETLEQEKGKPLDKEDLDGVAKGLLRKWGGGWFSKDRPLFEKPEAESGDAERVKDTLRQVFIKKNGYEPQPEQLQAAIAAYNFNVFYAKNKAGNQSAGAQ